MAADRTCANDPAPPPDLVAAGRHRLAEALAEAIERGLVQDRLPPEQAVSVLCSVTAALVTLDPSTSRGEDALHAFAVGLWAEADRLRTARAERDTLYRAAMAAMAG